MPDPWTIKSAPPWNVEQIRQRFLSFLVTVIYSGKNSCPNPVTQLPGPVASPLLRLPSLQASLIPSDCHTSITSSWAKTLTPVSGILPPGLTSAQETFLQRWSHWSVSATTTTATGKKKENVSLGQLVTHKTEHCLVVSKGIPASLLDWASQTTATGG